METGVRRLLDAVINRAMEGIRVCEDICRFLLGDIILASELKRQRHHLREYCLAFDETKLLSNRDVEKDNIKFINEKGEMERSGSLQIIRSNIHRATEAIRTIEEYSKIYNIAHYNDFQVLRFKLYDFEKKIINLLFRENKTKSFYNSLTVIINSQSSDDGQYAKIIKKLASLQVKAVHLRIKKKNKHDLFIHAKNFATACRESGIISIINDYPEVAMMVEADGVHLGKQDLPVDEVRKFIDINMIIGYSVHTLEEARLARKKGIDYLFIGPIFDVEDEYGISYKGIGLENYSSIVDTSHIPSFSCGDINLENIDMIIKKRKSSVAIYFQHFNENIVEKTCNYIINKLNEE